jgi:predicted TIM-barrel fold metal-dependent hydrolase
MAVTYNVISADNHVLEPRDLFVTRMPKEFRDRAPRVVRAADGGDGWSFEGKPPQRSLGLEATAGRTAKAWGYTWEDILPGNYDGAAHVADMRNDGVDAAVLFPTIVMGAYSMPDLPFALALIQTYNDWLFSDFVAADPKALIGLAVLPVNHGVECAIAELKRCRAKGARSFFIPTYPDIPYIDRQYDPLWAAAAEAGTPLCLHRTSGGKDPMGMGTFQFDIPGVNVAGTVIRFFSGVQPLTHFIFTGVFDRHPTLVIVDAEVNFGWIPFWKQTMDQCYAQQKGWAQFPFAKTPSEYLGKNVFVTVLDDQVGFDQVRFDPQLADVALFSIDYPHSVCLWPNSADYIERVTKNVDPVSKAKILAGNSERVFGLN